MKKVVYTCVTGGYDIVKDPEFITEGFDYICFTDNKEMKSDVWDIRLIEGEEFEGLSDVKKQRFIKICPHLFIKNYDLSIWVDGNVRLTENLNDFLELYCNKPLDIFIPNHPSRDCIYDEMAICDFVKKDRKDIMEKQMKRYRKEGYPKNYGLVQSNIIVRRHNRASCIQLMNDWWYEVKKGSHRDQLSFNYCLWKNPKAKIWFLGFNTCYSKWFKWEIQHYIKPVKVDETSIEKKKEDLKKCKIYRNESEKDKDFINEINNNQSDDETIRFLANNLRKKAEERIKSRTVFR